MMTHLFVNITSLDCPISANKSFCIYIKNYGNQYMQSSKKSKLNVVIVIVDEAGLIWVGE
jgi:hypothetical protein